MLKSIIKKLIFLFVLLLPLQTVFIFDEKIINGVKWQYGTGAIYFTELIFWLIAILTLFYLIKQTPPQDLWHKMKTSHWDKQKLPVILLLLLVLWTTLSLLWASELSAAFYLWLKLIEGITLFIIIAALMVEEKYILWPLSLAAAAEGLLAFWQFITQTSLANKWLGAAEHTAGRLSDIVIETANGRWLRSYGTFSHPNVLGGFCAIGLLASLNLAAKAKNKNQILFLFLIIINSLGLFFSFSRSAWLAAALALLLMIIKTIKDKNYPWLRFAFTAVVTIVVMSVIFSPLIISRSNLSNRLEKRSANERFVQIDKSLMMIKTFPLTGVGLNNFTYILYELDPILRADNYQPVHNLYLLIASELGLTGLIIFILFLAALAAYNKNDLCSWGWLAPILLIGLVDHYFWTQYAGILIFWLTLTIYNKSAKITR